MSRSGRCWSVPAVPPIPLSNKLADGMMSYGSVGSPPSVIADTILKALRSKRPKTRYAAGQYARPVLLLANCSATGCLIGSSTGWLAGGCRTRQEVPRLEASRNKSDPAP